MSNPSLNAFLFTALFAMALPALAEGPAADKANEIPVTVTEVRQGVIRSLVFGQGTARSVQREFLLLEQAGKVVEIAANLDGGELREGDRVTGPTDTAPQGMFLARQDDRDAQASLDAAIADRTRAEAQLKTSRLDLARKEALAKKKSIAQADVDVARASATEAQAAVTSAGTKVRQAEIALEKTRLYAPIDGVIARLNIREGQYYSPNFLSTKDEDAVLNTAPIVIIDPDRFEITLDLPSFDGLDIAPGQTAFVLTSDTAARLSIEGIEGDENTVRAMTIPATVYSVSPSITPGGRSVQIKLRTSGDSAALHDGQFINAWIVTEQKDDALIVPRNALLFRDQSVYAFRADGDDKAERREITLGIRGLKGVEIATGMAAGDRVVTHGRERLTTGTPLRIGSGSDQ